MVTVCLQVDANDRKDQIQYIRRNWDKTLNTNAEFVNKLKEVSFVATAAGHTARPRDLFHPAHPIFSRVFQSQPVFPTGEFLEPGASHGLQLQSLWIVPTAAVS